MKKIVLYTIIVMAAVITLMFSPTAAYGASLNAGNFSSVPTENVDTLVTLKVSDGFVVTIPESIVLSEVKLGGAVSYRTNPSDPTKLPAVDLVVTAINASKRINVTVNSVNYSKGNWTMTGEKSHVEVPYYLKADLTGGNDHIDTDDIKNKETNLLRLGSQVLRSNTTMNVKLHALVAENPSVTDNFGGTLTFTVTYEDNTEMLHP